MADSTAKPGDSRRRVIGTEAIDKARNAGRRWIEIRPDDIVTELARESAQQLDIEFKSPEQTRIAPLRSNPAHRNQRELLRRSPKWMGISQQPGKKLSLIPKLAVVGVGGVGGSVAHLAANLNIAKSLALLDITPGLAEATALDLQHACGISGGMLNVSGGSDANILHNADVVVVTAGKARTPGMSRSDLAGINYRIITKLAESIKTQAHWRCLRALNLEGNESLAWQALSTQQDSG